MLSDPDRLHRGEEKIGEILGQTGDRVRGNLADIAPDFATYVLEVVYGDIYQNATLDAKTRQIVTVATVAAQGHAQPQLVTHLNGALRLGWTREELIQVLLQVAVFAGLPAGLNAVDTARAVFARLDAQEAVKKNV
jgi:4-carboxymuconolactone decarboxylase